MLSFFVAIYLIWRILGWLFLSAFRSGAFGASPSAMIISLAILTILFPVAVRDLIYTPISVFFSMITAATRITSTIIGSFNPNPSSGSYGIAELFTALLTAIERIALELVTALQPAAQTLLATDVLTVLALWSLLGNIVTGLSTEGPPSGTSRGGVKAFLRMTTSAQRLGAMLTAVFAFGAYLSIAAIVAIPWFHEDKASENLTIQAFEKTLNDAFPSSVVSTKASAPATENMDEMLKQAEQALNDSPSMVSALQTFRKNWTEANEQLTKMPLLISDRTETAKKRAIAEFASYTESMNNRERSFFINSAKDAILFQNKQISAAQAECALTLSNVRVTLDISLGVIKTSPPSPSRDNQILAPIINAESDIANACSPKSTDDVTFAHLSAKASWGPFGSLANWLLQTKSSAVALITGMIGFGLVGSVLATLIQRRSNVQSASLMVETASILVRGFSAAIVVFLAVQGGLGAFSTGESQPNAYVLFFTCLVGAVFSEDVWAWAHKKGLSNLTGARATLRQSPTVAQSIERRGGARSSDEKKEGRYVRRGRRPYRPATRK